MNGKKGRPKTDNPKNVRFTIRINADTENKLEKYCEENKVSKGEAIRRAVSSFFEVKNNKTANYES